jgi:hypothetical protein
LSMPHTCLFTPYNPFNTSLCWFCYVPLRMPKKHTASEAK